MRCLVQPWLEGNPASAQGQRERPPRRASAAAVDAVFALVSAPESEAEDPPGDRPAGAPASLQPQLKRKRGRPRRHGAPRLLDGAQRISEPQQPKRKRGRPRKSSPLPADLPDGGEGEGICAAAVSASSAELLPGSALPSLGLPKVPSLLMLSRLSGSGDLFTSLCRHASPRLQPMRRCDVRKAVAGWQAGSCLCKLFVK